MVLEEIMKQKNKSGILALSLIFMLSGCSLANGSSKNASGEAEKGQTVNAKASTSDQLVENRRIYENDKDDSVIDLYVTVLKDGSQSDFYEMNHWYDNGETSDTPKLKTIVQEGGPNGPSKDSWGYGTEISNSTIEVRGNSSRFVPQKSFKIKLLESAGLWHGQTIINLNKHQYDITRIRQKLSFDLLKEIPDFTSLRTQFVRLHVKDLTAQQPDQQFVDYGLFTHVEQPNKRSLYSHGLDPNGNLYKANMFEFLRYPEQLKLATDSSYNKDEFEAVLQIKGSNEHDKLLKMLEDVNDYELNINDVIKKHFNRENYLSWLAVNILMGNIDTDAQNYFLYSPINSQKFYFLPWDYDGAWGQTAQEEEGHKGYNAQWQMGISNYWGSVLHQRFFKDPKNIKDLSKKIEELSKIISEEKVKQKLDMYYPIANQYIHQSPDLQGVPFRIEKFDSVYKSLAKLPEQNKTNYYKSLENPMPIYLGDPELKNGSYEFTWDSSYDFQGEDLTYDFQISQKVDFSSVYIEEKDLNGTSIKIDANNLNKGMNYWRVIVKDSKGNTQIAFDRLTGEDDNYYNGERELFIK
jgi:spore coat protein H